MEVKNLNDYESLNQNLEIKMLKNLNLQKKPNGLLVFTRIKTLLLKTTKRLFTKEDEVYLKDTLDAYPLPGILADQPH